MLSRFIFVSNNIKMIIVFCYTFVVAFFIAMQVLPPLVKYVNLSLSLSEKDKLFI